MKKNSKKGTILILTFLTLGILFLLGSFFLAFALTDARISKSQTAGSKTYCLAEAGINEAIWKLKNDNTTTDGDPAWMDDFIDPDKNPFPDGSYWTATFSHNFGDGFYTITIQNSARGRGKIITVAILSLPNGKTAQRIVKTTVFKAIASPVGDGALFSGGTSENINIDYSRVKINKGNIYSNHNLNIKGQSTIEVYDNSDTTEILEGKTLTVGNFSRSNDSTLVTEAICAKDVCTEKCEDYPPEENGCPPFSLTVPLVDFNSSSPDSFKERAQTYQNLAQCQVLCNGALCGNKCIYSASEFEDLLWQAGMGGTLTLNNVITYVTGNIDLKGGRYLIINGVLVADDNINIGESYFWTNRGIKDSGFSQITINQPGDENPSGLLTKRKINFGEYSSFQPINIAGIIYANDEIRIVSVPESFNIIGGIIARKISLISLWQWLNITLDNDIIIYGLGYKINGRVVNPELKFSSVITIEHWEENY